MRLSVHHQTHYTYVGEASSSHNEIRLKPMSNDVQRCLEYNVKIQPNTRYYEYETIGGFVNHFAIIEPHRELNVVVESIVETLGGNVFSSLDLVSRDLVAKPSDEYCKTYAEFLCESPYVLILPEVRKLAGEILARSEGNTVQFILNLKENIFENFTYQANLTNVHSTLREVLDLSAGVCQDFSHLMIGCCRAAGLPARYVSGYLYLGEHHELRGTQATHAWVEVLLPNGQWLGVDPTNNILADDRYIKVHVGRDYSDVTPIKGVFVGYGTQQMDVTVNVRALNSA